MHAASDTRTIDVDTDLVGRPLTDAMKAALAHAADKSGRTWPRTHDDGNRITAATLKRLARRGLVTLELTVHQHVKWTSRGNAGSRWTDEWSAELTERGHAAAADHTPPR